MERKTIDTAISPKSYVAQAAKDFGLLVKFKLTLLVLFSALMSYAIVAEGNVTFFNMLMLALGGFLVTGSANALNQIIEREHDKIMTRTADRPIAAGRMSVSTALLYAGVMALAGIAILSTFNMLTGLLGAVSLISYAFVYTPLKRSTPLAVAVGAVPGALPLIIGATAYEGYISPMGSMLFALQFLWQFPHFWAVAWLADEDYRRAGFYLLPTGRGAKDSTTGYMSLWFCIFMVANAAMGLVGGYFSVGAFLILSGLNLYWAFRCYQLYKNCSRESARKQMFVSFWLLPVSLIVLYLDKIF